MYRMWLPPVRITGGRDVGSEVNVDEVKLDIIGVDGKAGVRSADAALCRDS